MAQHDLKFFALLLKKAMAINLRGSSNHFMLFLG
jgi:hypothetical protein